MRVLAIAAHPDDIEWLCGGTLALCAQRGDEIFIAIATNGNVGSGEPGAKKDEIARIRHEEAKTSAAVIGAKVIWMDFDDEFLFDDESSMYLQGRHQEDTIYIIKKSAYKFGAVKTIF